MCSSVLSLKVLRVRLSSVERAANTGIRQLVKWSQEVKKLENSKAVTPKTGPILKHSLKILGNFLTYCYSVHKISSISFDVNCCTLCIRFNLMRPKVSTAMINRSQT